MPNNKIKKPIRQIGDAILEVLSFNANTQKNAESFIGEILKGRKETIALIKEIKANKTIQAELDKCVMAPILGCRENAIESHVVSRSQLEKLAYLDQDKKSYSIYTGASDAAGKDILLQVQEWSADLPTLRLFCKDCDSFFTGSPSPDCGFLKLPLFPKAASVDIDNPNLSAYFEEDNSCLDFSLKFPPKGRQFGSFKVEDTPAHMQMYLFYVKYQLRICAYYARASFIRKLVFCFLATLPFSKQNALLTEWGLSQDALKAELEAADDELVSLANIFGMSNLDASTAYLEMMKTVSGWLYRLGHYKAVVDQKRFYAMAIPFDVQNVKSFCSTWGSKKQMSKETFDTSSYFCGVLPVVGTNGMNPFCIIAWIEEIKNSSKNTENKEEAFGGKKYIQYFGVFGLMDYSFIRNLNKLSNKRYLIRNQIKMINQVKDTISLLFISQTKGGLPIPSFFGNKFFMEKFKESHESLFGKNPYIYKEQWLEAIALEQPGFDLLGNAQTPNQKNSINQIVKDLTAWGRVVVELMVKPPSPIESTPK